MKIFNRKNILIICIIVLIGIFYVSRNHRSVVDDNRYSEIRPLMGTFVQLDICREGIEDTVVLNAYQAVWSRLEDIAWRMNVYDQKSDVTLVNQNYVSDQSAAVPVAIGEDTYQLLQRSKDFTLLTGGAFDITVWPLIELWREKQKQNILPTQNEIADVQLYRGIQFLQFLSDHQIKNTGMNTKIDLGGIAKGYAIDEAARIFKEHDIANFYIDAGGDNYVGGLNCRGEKWMIGIRDPQDRSEYIEVVALTNQAITTSGNYEQFLVIEGEQFSHIINPLTGYPQKDVVSATVIADYATDADALSTALTVMGPAKGLVMIDNLDDTTAAILMVKDLKTGQVSNYESKNYQNFRKP